MRSWTTCSPSAANAKGTAALNPEPWFEPLQGEAAPRWIKAVTVAPAVLDRVDAIVRRTSAAQAAELRDRGRAVLIGVLPRRLFLAGAEMDEAVEAARAELARAERRTQPRELAQAGIRGARLALALAERSRVLRLQRLRDLPAALAEANHHAVGSLLLRPIRSES